MPLAGEDLRDVHGRLMRMFEDTIKTFEAMEHNADKLYAERATEVQAAIHECLEDFVRNPTAAGGLHPETLVYRASKDSLQRAGLYGAQLAIKEQQVAQANLALRARIAGGVSRLFRQRFRKWVDVTNNFLRSLAGATGVGEALAELKDCLRDELPDDET